MIDKLLFRRLRIAVPLICGFTLVGLISGGWWPLELFDHFRVQYCVLLLAMGAVLAVIRRFSWAGVAFLCASANLWVIVPLYLADISVPVRDKSFRVVSLNLNRENREHGRVTRFIRASGADMVLLMELNGFWANRLAGLSDTYPYSIERQRQDNFGIALFSKIPLSHGAIKSVGDLDFPMLAVSSEVQGKPLIVIGAHPPPPVSFELAKMREHYLDELAGCVSRQKGSVVVLGDLNTTSWSPLFENLTRKTGLRDSRKGFGVQPTWPVWLPPLLIPVDHCLVSRDISVISRRVGTSVGSDHYPVIVDLGLGGCREASYIHIIVPLSQAPVVWRLPRSLTYLGFHVTDDFGILLNWQIVSQYRKSIAFRNSLRGND